MSPQPRTQRRAPDDELPEYERPPLAEVVLGLQFDPLVGMTTARLGAAWELFRRQFPRTEDQAPIATTFERFDSPSDGAPALQWNLDLLGRPALPRVWLINEDGDELVQLQNDRFLHNWRKVDARPDYPRYSKLRAKFEREARLLDRWVVEQGLGSITPNQCEVTYVNHIIADDHWREHHEASKLLRLVAEGPSGKYTGRPEQVRFEASFLIREGASPPRGRLHVSLAPGFLKQGLTPMFALTLTARGAPIGDNLEGALEFLDLGHRSIVLGFDELTTDLMHGAWGRRSR